MLGSVPCRPAAAAAAACRLYSMLMLVGCVCRSVCVSSWCATSYEYDVCLASWLIMCAMLSGASEKGAALCNLFVVRV